jgi:hypothetical protein
MLSSGILGEVNPKQAESLKAIDHCVERQADRIASVLDMIKAEENRLELHIDVVNLLDIVQRCVSLSERDCKRRNLQVVATTEGSAAVMADMPRIQRVISTLLGRCIRDAAQGSRIGVELHNFGAVVRVRLWDTGNGSTTADTEILRQSAREQTISRMNTGAKPNIELAPIFDIMALHGGKIVVQTEEGTGTTYLLYLPAAKKNPAPEIVTPRRALLVSCDANENAVLKAALQQNSIEAQEMPGCVEALKAAREQHFPLVFISNARNHPNIDRLPEAIRQQRPDEPQAICLVWHGGDASGKDVSNQWIVNGAQIDAQLGEVLTEMMEAARLQPPAPESRQS